MAGRKLPSTVDAWLVELAKKFGSRKSRAGATLQTGELIGTVAAFRRGPQLRKN
jgi:hypothetical protein